MSGDLLGDAGARERIERLECLCDRLKDGRNRYSELFDFAPDSYFDLDRSGEITEVNLAGMELLGLNRQDLLHRTFVDFVHSEDAGCFTAYLSEIKSKGEICTCEVRLRLASNRTRIASIHGMARGNADDEPHFHLIVRDVTEQIEEARRQRLLIRLLEVISSEATCPGLLKGITETLGDWLKCDAMGIRLQRGEDFPYFESRGFSRQFLLVENSLCACDESGEPIRDLTGKTVLECMCGNILSGRFDPSKPFFTASGSFWTNSTTELLASTTEKDRMARTRNRCNTNGYESVALIPLRCENETSGLLQINHKAKGLFSPDLIRFLETVAGYLAFALAHRFAADQLKESKTEYQRIVETANEGIWVLDAGRITTFVNPQMASMLGRQPEDMIGRHLEEFVFEDDLPAYEKRMKERATGRAERYLQRWRHSDGHAVWCQVSPAPIIIADGSFGGSFAMFTDVTAQRRAEELLERSNAELKALYSHAPVMMCLLDKNRNVLFANQAFTGLTGVKEEELLAGRACGVFGCINARGHELGCGHGPKCVDCQIRLALQDTLESGRSHHDVEYRATLVHGGRERTVVLLGSTARIRRSGDFALLLCFQNISEREKASEELRLASNRLDIATNSAGVGIWEYDGGTQRTIWSDVMYSLFGLAPDCEREPEELWREGVHPDDRERVYGGVQNVLRTGNDKQTDYRVVWPDGSIHYLHGTAHPHRDASGQVVGIIGTDIDITERKLVEEATRRQRDRAQSYLDTVETIVVALDSKGKITTINRKGCRLFGCREDELIGRDWFATCLPQPEGTDKVYPVFLKIITDELEAVEYFENSIITRDGETRNMAWHNAILRDDQGRIVGTLSSGEDITERKRAEQALSLQNVLLDSIRKAQAMFLWRDRAPEVFRELLQALVTITESQFGFIDEVRCDEDGSYYKISLALPDISWDESSHRLYKDLAERGMRFGYLDNLAGLPVLTGEAVIANDVGHDPRAKGLPPGHPPIFSYMGIPMFHCGQIVGVAAVANRKGGYDRQMAQFLEPFINACAELIHAFRTAHEERKYLEAIQSAEARLQSMLHAVTDSAFLITPDGTVLTINAMGAERLGLTPEDISGKCIYDFIPPDVAASRRKMVDQAAAQGKPVEFEDERHGIRFLHMVYPVLSSDGQVTALAIFGRDITERHRNRLAEKEATRRFQTVADYTWDWEYWQAPDGQIKYMSPSVRRITGYDREEFVSDPGLLERIVHPDDLHSWRQHEESAGFPHEPRDFEFRIKIREGETRWIGHVCVEIIDANGESHGRRVSNRDITELKRAEASVLAEQETLRNKNVALKEVLAHIESEKNRIKDQIAANKDRVILPLLAGLKHKVGKENLTTIDKVVKALEEITSPFANELSRRFASLSPREVEVCAMIKNGMLSKEIADCLGVSIQTVHKFRQRIRQKLGISNEETDLGQILRSIEAEPPPTL